MTTTIQTAKVTVTIEGILPGLLFQGKGLMELEADGTTKRRKPRTPEEEAELRAHWKGRGRKRELAIPSVMLYKSSCQAAIEFKQPHNKKKNMSFLVAPTVAFEEDMIGLGTAEFETFKEWVRIPPFKGAMVKIGRPLLRKWSATFTMVVDEEQWPAELLEDIIVLAGKNVGIGAWRPGLKGPYGRFVLKKFAIKRE